MPVGPMVPLTTTPDAFAAKVVAARLGSEGFLWELRGNVDGPYPLGAVQVLVASEDLAGARYLLLADEIEASYDEFDGIDGPERDDARRAGRAPLALWLLLFAILSASFANLTRLLVL